MIVLTPKYYEHDKRFLAKVDVGYYATFAYLQSNIHIDIITQNGAPIHRCSTLVDVEHYRLQFARGKPQAAHTTLNTLWKRTTYDKCLPKDLSVPVHAVDVECRLTMIGSGDEDPLKGAKTR